MTAAAARQLLDLPQLVEHAAIEVELTAGTSSPGPAVLLARKANRKAGEGWVMVSTCVDPVRGKLYGFLVRPTVPVELVERLTGPEAGEERLQDLEAGEESPETPDDVQGDGEG